MLGMMLRRCGMGCRSPHGERGLKCGDAGAGRAGQRSLPAWGAWIEMSAGDFARVYWCRSPHGERGLKLTDNLTRFKRQSRSPHGERGLKSLVVFVFGPCPMVAPRMGSVD